MDVQGAAGQRAPLKTFRRCQRRSRRGHQGTRGSRRHPARAKSCPPLPRSLGPTASLLCPHLQRRRSLRVRRPADCVEGTDAKHPQALASLQPVVSVRLVGTHEGLDVLPGTHLGDTDPRLWGTRKVGRPSLYPVPRPHSEGTEIYTCCWQYPGLSLTWRIWVVF